LPFKVTGTSSNGAEAISCADASAALKVMLMMENDGYTTIVVKDSLERTVDRHELVMLVYPNS